MDNNSILTKNTGSGDGLVPSGNKSFITVWLPGATLTQIYISKWNH